MADESKILIKIVFDDGTVKETFASIKKESEKTTDGIKKDFNKAEKKIKDTGKNGGKGFAQGFASQVKGIGATLAISLGILVADAVKKAIGTVIEQFKAATESLRGFGKGVAEINTLLPNTAKLNRENASALQDLAVQFGTSQQAQARSLYQIISAGILDVAEASEVLAVANKAATAGLVETKEAANAILTAINAYGRDTLSAAEASDSLFQAVRDGRTTFPELALSIGRVTSLAAAAGVPFQDLSAAIATLTRRSVLTDEAVTGLRQAFVGILNPSVQAKKAAREFGIELSERGIRAAGGFVNFLKILREETGGNATALAKIIPNVRALNAVVVLTGGNFEEFEQIVRNNRKSIGATDEAFKDLRNTLDFDINKLVSAWDVFRTRVLERFEPILRILALEARKLIESITPQPETIAEKFNRLQEAVTTTAKKYSDLNHELLILEAGFASNQGALLTSQRYQELSAKVNDAATKARIAKAEFAALQDQLAQTGPDLPEPKIPKGQTPIIEPFVPEGQLTQAQQKLEELQTATANAQFAIGGSMGQIGVSFGQTAGSILQASKDASKAIKNTLVSGASKGIQRLTTRLVEGKSVFDDFGKFVLEMFADLAIQIGTIAIGSGIAVSAIPKGPGAIAAGAALIAVGAAIKAFIGKGGVSVPGGREGGGAGSLQQFPSPDEFLQEEEVDREPQTVVNLNVAGNIFDSDDTGDRIVSLVNDAFDERGVVLRQSIA